MASLLLSKFLSPTTVAIRAQTRRALHLHEAYSMELLKSAGVAVPRAGIAHNGDEAVEVAKKLGSFF